MQCENDYYYHLPMKFLDTSKDYDMAKLYFLEVTMRKNRFCGRMDSFDYDTHQVSITSSRGLFYLLILCTEGLSLLL